MVALNTGKLFLITFISSVVFQTMAYAVPSNTSFEEAITLKNLITHLKAFQQIADKNSELPGTRYTSTQGFDESRDYIITKLSEAGYQVSVQNVPMDVSYVTTP